MCGCLTPTACWPANTTIVFIGDSLTRYQYLDLVYTLHHNGSRQHEHRGRERNPLEGLERTWGSWASFYTGTPGEEIGDFFGSFPDSNGVERSIDLNLCLMEDYHGQVGGTAGRATPEWCSFETQEGIDYRIVLQVFSAPVDDNELKYALDVRSGACPEVNECTLRGDYDEHEVDLPGGFTQVEELYCDAFAD